MNKKLKLMIVLFISTLTVLLGAFPNNNDERTTMNFVESSLNNPILVVQTPSNITRDNYMEGKFFIWFNVYNADNINALELKITTSEKINFIRLNLGRPNYNKNTVWQKFIEKVNSREIYIVCSILSETLRDNQTLGYALCQLEEGINYLESININVDISFTNPAGDDLQTEIKTLNNCSDMNFDGISSLEDINIFLTRYGTRYGENKFAPVADYNCDGFINFDDLGYFVNSFLKEQPDN